MSQVSVLRLTLFKDSKKSFLEALDREGVEHSSVECFSTQPRASGFIEAITAISDAMPWNSIAKVIVAWINARKSREVIITLEGNKIIHARGYSINDLEKILPKSINVAVIDTSKSNED